jgi:hypothetical protein
MAISNMRFRIARPTYHVDMSDLPIGSRYAQLPGDHDLVLWCIVTSQEPVGGK